MRLFANILLCILGWVQIAQATSHTEVELVNLSPAVESGQLVRVGLKFKCEPNYHIYWKNVGDAGTPPSLNWKP